MIKLGRGVINLGEDNQESICIERLEGKMAAKKLARQGKGKNPMHDNVESAIDVQMEIQELRKQKQEHVRRQDDQFQFMYAAKQEQLTIRCKEVPIQCRREVSRIMAMKTTNMLLMQAEYIIGLQNDILAKRSGNSCLGQNFARHPIFVERPMNQTFGLSSTGIRRKKPRH
ncbi:hypothetical protein L3X38_032925 [Prunus dulcis]|uniref:Uncharacterized protein n=1 Tax=Prunus dulcis TaxID=3755 RepID=A0AAD4VHB3_PRUDU|nr:hypothetical protein L3X38_032925 [Prunus dulcis]